MPVESHVPKLDKYLPACLPGKGLPQVSGGRRKFHCSFTWRLQFGGDGQASSLWQPIGAKSPTARSFLHSRRHVGREQVVGCSFWKVTACMRKSCCRLIGQWARQDRGNYTERSETILSLSLPLFLPIFTWRWQVAL